MTSQPIPPRSIRVAVTSGFLAGAVLGAALMLGGCGGVRNGETLIESVRTYNDGVRWQRYTAAAGRIPPGVRASFVEGWDERSKDLKVTDYELLQVTSQSSRTAKVQVKITWYKETEGTVHETTAAQAWERRGKVWWMIDQHRLRGPEMPGLAEPDAEDQVDDYADPSDDAALADDPKDHASL